MSRERQTKNWMRSETHSQWKLASVLVMWSERRSPATERTTAGGYS